MRTTTKQVVSTTEQTVLGDFTIEYNYATVEEKIQGSITATCQPYGRVTSYDGITLSNGLNYKIGDENVSLIEAQIAIDISEISTVGFL